jgi:hypothetical protein
MTVGGDYRARAAIFRAEAEKHNDPNLRAKYENLAELYLRLAEHVDKRPGLTIDFELPSEEDGNTKH